MEYSPLILKKDEERRLLAGHLWIYSNEIDNKRTPLKQFSSGELVNVTAANGNKFGTAYINPHTLLSARLLTHQANEKIDKQFFINRIKNALAIRSICYDQSFYRLVFGESDFLPGLVIERFNDIYVIQISTVGMENLKAFIIDALIYLFQPKGVLLKNDNQARETENLPLYVESAYGEVPKTIIFEENNTKFIVPLYEGQKTGWFFDQFANRRRLLPFIKDKQVLDIFSYIGAWGITAATHGASEVTCVDSSQFALELLQQNAKLNNVNEKVKTIKQNAFSALNDLIEQNEKYDVIILDPPALIKSRKDFKAGITAYHKLHQQVLQLLNKEPSILFSTSCSMRLEQSELLNIIRKTAKDAKRKLRIIEFLHQAADHPIHPAILETNYLKGFAAIS